MKKKDLEITQKVMFDGEMFTIVNDVQTESEIIVENEKGKRRYTNAGALKNPEVILNIRLSIKVVLDEGGYHVSCPQLKGFHTCGETIEKCLRNAKYAGEGFIKSIIKHYNEEHKSG